MDPFIVVVCAGLIVVGSVAALAWWHLARKAMPYRDEPKSGERSRDDQHEVIVLPPSDSRPRQGS